MNKRYLTDDTGTILAIFTYDEDGLYLAMKQGKQLAKAFPDSEIYLHEVFTTGKLEVGMSSSMRGSLLRFYKDGSTTTVNLYSGYSTSHTAPDSHTTR